MVRGSALGALILFLSVGAWAQEARKIPKAVACNNDDETCRESCTIEFGSSFRTRARLGKCLEACRARHHRCTEQWTELHRNNLDPENETKPAEAVTADVAVEEVQEPPPPEDEAPAEEAPPYNEGITIPSDEQLAGPAAAPREEKPAKKPGTKRVEAPKPKPPPPPEKKQDKAEKEYDISEWDPDGE